jgi:hypothetical protein
MVRCPLRGYGEAKGRAVSLPEQCEYGSISPVQAPQRSPTEYDLAGPGEGLLEVEIVVGSYWIGCSPERFRPGTSVGKQVSDHQAVVPLAARESQATQERGIIALAARC